VTVNAFDRQLEVNFNMKKAVAILDDICCGRTRGADLELACSQTVKTFREEEVLAEIKEEVLCGLANVKKDDVVAVERWAVRSSAIGEDSEELSAAGQNETFLGCTSPDDVIKAISSCWASLFAYQSVQYRHKHGLPIASQMAVVVQRMVPADCAGVLFTCHPSTANPAHIVITANHGLGESVVSGRSEPDTVILERTFDNDLTIKSKTLGSKGKMTRMSDEGVEDTEGLEGFSVTDNQALDLGRVGVSLEEEFGSARDIEWAYCQGRLFLLQSRPVTTLHAWSDSELLHEFDVATLSEDTVYTVANTGEILPGAISVLTLSTVAGCIDAAIQRSIANANDPYVFKCLPTFQHHLFVDVIASIHFNVSKTVNITSKIVDLAIFGHPIINETIHSLSLGRFGPAGALHNLKELVQMVQIAWRNDENVKLSKTIARTVDVGIDRQRDTPEDIYVKIDNFLEKLLQVLQLHCLTTRTSVSYQVFAMSVLAENQQDFNVDHYNDVAMLLSSCEDVISAEIPSTLADIARILIEDGQADQFVALEPQQGRKWLEDNAPKAAEVFEGFLREHGHRALREFDIYSRTWGTSPGDVVRMIQSNCKTTTPKQTKTAGSLDDVIAGLASPQRSATRTILKFLMKKSRRAVGIREQTKSESVRLVNKLRIAYRVLGEKMTLAGLIPDQELVFHLTHYEVGQLIQRSERSPVLITKASKRQKLYPKWDKLKFPEISYGLPQPENRDFIPRTGTGKVKCEGTPVCAGVVQARACVITDLAEIDQLKDGPERKTRPHCITMPSRFR
jgi:hypothetical protein